MENKDKQELLRLGQATEFWRLITGVLDENIASLRGEQDSEDLKELSNDQYKIHNELLKAKIKYNQRLKELPDTLIAHLQSPNQEGKDYDPYDK
jgi:hypothetical protein